MLPHIGLKTRWSICNSPNFQFFFASCGVRHFLKCGSKGIGMNRLMVTVVATSLNSALLQKPTLLAQKADCPKTFFCPRWHRDTFLTTTLRNWRYVTSPQSPTRPVKILVFALFYSLNLDRSENSLFEVARLLPDANRHVASCVEVASLDGDSGAPRYGTLGRLDTGEVWSLE